MEYTVRFHSSAADDLMAMDKYSAIWIKGMINDKLVRKPESYGKPLRKKAQRVSGAENQFVSGRLQSGPRIHQCIDHHGRKAKG